MSIGYVEAWIGVLAAGWLGALALSAPRVPGRAAATFGYGIVFGMLGAALVSAVTARADTQHASSSGAPWLVAFAACAGIAVLWRQRRAAKPQAGAAEDGAPWWTHGAVALALASLIWRGSLAASEVLLRPTYPWDAWDAWAVKSKTWFLLGHFAPFVAVGDWLARAGTELFSGPAWAYPATLAWMQVWFASGAGGWIEPLVNLPWFALWAGLLFGHYGQWRALGLSAPRAALGAYALGSMPLLLTHVALAGYADLWIATLFGFGVLAWMRWQERGEADQLACALGCALVLPLVKLEGMVWCLSLLAAIGVGALPRHWRWRAVAIALALVALVAIVGESRVLFAAIGWVRSGSRVVDIPVIGQLALAWHGEAARGVLSSLFLQSNWHVLWWLVVPIVVWRWRALRASDAMTLCALLLLACFGLLAFLFVFTDAAEWAESYTAVNRLVMHVTPSLISLLALLLREVSASRVPAESSDTGRSSAPLADRA